MKRLLGTETSPPGHWVGDGFPVRSLFSYMSHGERVSPFLLLDYASPTHFPPAERPRGVGAHPHRGFETVTIVYQGELEHRDSAGNQGRIGAGDVQWMTAASGVVHEEFHGSELTRTGGMVEMAQLWVNLPARHKMSRPGYQEIQASRIPEIELGNGAGAARLIAGELLGAKGPARTFTPLLVADLRLAAGGSVELPVPDGHRCILAVLAGSLQVAGGTRVDASGLALFSETGSGLDVASPEPSRALLLAGQPIDEPVVGQGPFVMNTREEIAQAIRDYQGGGMGHLA